MTLCINYYYEMTHTCFQRQLWHEMNVIDETRGAVFVIARDFGAKIMFATKLRQYALVL
jgi:hypothetical protein